MLLRREIFFLGRGGQGEFLALRPGDSMVAHRFFQIFENHTA
jgi:hypothetical protein